MADVRWLDVGWGSRSLLLHALWRIMGGVVGKRGNGIARFIREINGDWERRKNILRIICINDIFYPDFMVKNIMYRGKWENNVKRVIYYIIGCVYID